MMLKYIKSLLPAPNNFSPVRLEEDKLRQAKQDLKRIQDGWNMPEGMGARFYQMAEDKEAGVNTEGMAFPEPDIPVDLNDLRYVSGFILPHHFKHPVTGKPSTEPKHNARLEPYKPD